jgi:uncharacterized cupin superfamily protein
MTDWTIENLDDVEDSAASFGHGDTQEAHFAREALGAEATGVSLHRVKPGRRQAFGHAHVAAEEVYVVLGGSGRVKLDDAVRDLKRLDAVRVAPAVKRAFEGGPDGIELLAFGPHTPKDGEIVPDFWPED